MSEEVVYATKYRPKNFTNIVGNERTVNSFLAMLRQDGRPQVILIEGASGCGKTTFARLIAKEYLCEDRDIITGACDKCTNCIQMNYFIETGDYGMIPNIKEIDVSDANKKQDIEMLLEDAQLPSITGDWKVYILDECHTMSEAAQNRLLKVLEEPPKNVLFLLCTTNADKLLDTLQSRCQYIYTISKPNKTEIIKMLNRVVKAEKLKYDEKGLNMLVSIGDYTPRKVLMAMQRVVKEKGSITASDVRAVYDILADEYYFNFFNYLLETPVNTMQYIVLINDVREKMNISDFVSRLTNFVKKGIYIANGIMTTEMDKDEVAAYSKIFKKFSAMDIAWLLDFLVNITYKRDMEAKLLLLGYTGINPQFVTVAKEEKKQDIVDNAVETAKDKTMSTENKKEYEKPNEQAIAANLEKYTSEVGIEELANLFNGVVTNLETPDK